MKIFMLLVCGLYCCIGNSSNACEWTRARNIHTQPVYAPVQQFQPVVSWSYVQQNTVTYVPTIVYQPVVNTQVVPVQTVIYPAYLLYSPVPTAPHFYGYNVYRY
jgi:hypothetical protein